MSIRNRCSPTQVANTPGLEDDIVLEEGRFAPTQFSTEEVWHTYKDADRGKIPCSAHSTTPSYIDAMDPDPDELVTLEEAMETVHHSESLAGVMLNIGALDDLTVIDLDDCVDPKTGAFSELAESLVDDLGDQFWELSCSGTGLHCYVLDSRGITEEYTQKGVIEVYEKRGIAFTGRLIKGTSAQIEAQRGLVQAYQKMHNSEKKSTTSSAQTGASVDSNPSETPSVRVERSWVGAGLSELSDDATELVEALLEFDDAGAELFRNGSSPDVWGQYKTKPEDDGVEPKPDRSRADLAWASKIVFWANESDMFEDTEFSRAELVKMLVAPNLMDREKSLRSDYIASTLDTAIELQG